MANVCSRLVEVGVVFLVVFTPIYYGSVTLGATTLIELTVLFMLMIWVIGMVVQGDLVFRRTPLDIPILLFCAYCIVSTLFHSKYLYASYTELLLVLCISALYFVVVNHIRSETQLMRLFVVILVVGSTHAFSHLAQNAGGLFRASTGVMLNVGNHFAGYMVIIIPLAVALSFAVKDIGKRVLLIFASIVMAAAMAFSLIAGAMLAFLFSLVLAALLFAGSESTRKKALVLGGIVFCLLLVIFWIGYTPVFKELLTVTNLRTGSVAGRLSLWKSSFAMFADNPIIGTGLGTFDYLYPRYRLPDMYGRAVYAHSDWLQLLTELGVIGFAILASGIAYFFLLITSRCKEVTRDQSIVNRKGLETRDFCGDWTKGLVVGGLSSIGAGLAHALVEFNFHIPAIAVLFAIIVALTVTGCWMLDARCWIIEHRVASIQHPAFRAVVFICLVPIVGFSAALILRPYLGEIHYRNGMRLEEELLWDEAAAEYQSALSISRSNGYYFYALGNVYAKRVKLTRQALEKLEQRGNTGASFLGKRLTKKAEYGGRPSPIASDPVRAGTQAKWATLALDAYHQAIELCPTYGDYSLVLGNLHEVMGNEEEAEAAYVKAISLDPNNAFYHRIYGSFCLRQGETRKAIVEYRKALAVYPRDLYDILNECYVILDTGYWILDTGYQHPASSIQKIAQEIRPQDIGSYVTSARFCISKGWHDAAFSEYQRAIALAEANAVRRIDLWSELSRLLMTQGKPQRAVALWEQFLSSKIVTGDELRVPDTGCRMPDAGIWYLDSATRDPQNAQARAQLAAVYVEQGRLDDAIRQYLMAASIDPDDSNYVIRAADLYMQKGESSEALELWQTLIKQKPYTAAVAYYRLGRYYEDQADWIRALGFFQRAIAADPKNIEYRLHLAHSYYKKELFYEAIQEWKRALSLHPENVSIHLQLARAYQRIDVQDKARQHYRQVLELRPENMEARSVISNQ